MVNEFNTSRREVFTPFLKTSGCSQNVHHLIRLIALLQPIVTSYKSDLGYESACIMILVFSTAVSSTSVLMQSVSGEQVTSCRFPISGQCTPSSSTGRVRLSRDRRAMYPLPFPPPTPKKSDWIKITGLNTLQYDLSS